MPLAPGHQFGPYEILAKLGEGGMGEVYKARDSKLNREVAIKVLPQSLANDPEYLARFQREAQSLAALHHPHIATIFGLEQNSIVMELIDGRPLEGPLPIEIVLPIAKQIAEALEAAHDKGIIHRDLKPANILLTPENQVKILDFGLAKAVETTTQSDRTLTLQSTQAGLILGTAAYMSPEQAAGKPADRRADIWSFGVVLYELITGQQLFTGETVSHILAEVLKTEIDFTKIPAGPLRQLLQRCLDRNIKTRLQHIGEARIALENAPAQPTPPPTTTNWLPWALTAACLLLLVTTVWLRTPAPPAALTRLEITPPLGTHFEQTSNNGGSAISPDGRTLAFLAAPANGPALLYLRPLDSLDARPLPGTEGAGRPFWSPDSKSLAFVAAGKLQRIDIAGGAPIVLCEATRPRGGDWREDGLIVFGDQNKGLRAIRASGGSPYDLIPLKPGTSEISHYYPQFLPGGKKVLYLERHIGDSEKNHLMVADLDGSNRVLLLQTDMRAIYDPANRRLLYIQGNGTLMSRAMELDPPKLTGDPIVVAEHVSLVDPNNFANFSVSANGTIVYGRTGVERKSLLQWFDRSGKKLESVGEPIEGVVYSALSPDSTRIAVITSQTPDIWVLDLVRGTRARLTNTGAANLVWSPDGKYIFYGDSIGLQRKPADGSGSAELIYRGYGSRFPQAISPDGKFLIHSSGDLLVLALTTPPKLVPFERTPAMEFGARFSPDGRWIAYNSNETDRNEIFVQGFPDRRGRWMISSSGGSFPSWRADGRELYWPTLNGTVMAAAIDLQGDAVKPGLPQPLFRVAAGTRVHPAPDGRRFLAFEPTGEVPTPPSMVVIQNWAADLPR